MDPKDMEINRLKAINAELLEALRNLVYRYKYDGSETDVVVKQAREIISKATGD